MSATPVQQPHRAYAGLVSRLAALAVDVALLTVLGLCVRLVPEFAYDQVLDHPAPGWFKHLAGLAAALLPWAYFSIAWSLNGRTPGGALMGIAVRRRDGRDLSLLHAAVRAAFGLLFFPLWAVGLLAILWDPQRRAWHDRVFRTVVLYQTAHQH